MYEAMLAFFFLYLFSFLSLPLRLSLKEEVFTLRRYLKQILPYLIPSLHFLFLLLLPFPFSLLLLVPFFFFLFFMKEQEEMYLSLSLSSLYAMSFALLWTFEKELLVLALIPLLFFSMNRCVQKEKTLVKECLSFLNLLPAFLFLLLL
jgi:hypothetical protein